MKKITYGFFILSLLMAVNACRKSDNPKLPPLTRFPIPLVTIAAGSDESISVQNPASFTAKIAVDMYFKNDGPAKSLDLVVIKNGNKSNVKLIQPNITTFPTTVSITGTQLMNLFGGTPIVLGDRFDLGVDVTTADGKKYEAFPVTGNSYASGISSQPGASTSVRFAAVCKYDPNLYKGNFVVMEDEWADYGVGDVVTLTMVDATHFSFNYLANNPQPIVVTVNTGNNSVSVSKQVYGSSYSAPSPWPYGPLSAQSVASPENFVAPCEGTFSVVLRHTGNVDFGTYKIVLKKQ